MLDAIRDQRLDVEILTETAARHHETDESGAISGVIARDPAESVRIKAKAVIPATGGFGKSDEKLREFAPWFFEGGHPHPSVLCSHRHRRRHRHAAGAGGGAPSESGCLFPCSAPAPPLQILLADMALEPRPSGQP